MSVGPAGGVPGSAAGAPLSQTRGSDAERTQQEATGRERRVATDRAAESAAGVGQTQEDSEVSDRDADGRRPWELDGSAEESSGEQPPADEESPPRQGRDASGESGQGLDLTA